MTEREAQAKPERLHHYPEIIKENDFAKRLFDEGIDAYRQYLKIHEWGYHPGFNVYVNTDAKTQAGNFRLREQKIVNILRKKIPDVNWIVEIRRETIARQKKIGQH